MSAWTPLQSNPEVGMRPIYTVWVNNIFFRKINAQFYLLENESEGHYS